MSERRRKLVIDAWPQLIEALRRQPMLGTSPEDIAKFLIVDGLDKRERELTRMKERRGPA